MVEPLLDVGVVVVEIVLIVMASPHTRMSRPPFRP
jgi:hypothetical protein